MIGGLDRVMHHVAFLAASVLAGWYQLVPFVFARLIIGESSTPFLTTRWTLIKTGNGGHWVFPYVERAFIACFLFTRLPFYSIGFAHWGWILWQAVRYSDRSGQLRS